MSIDIIIDGLSIIAISRYFPLKTSHKTIPYIHMFIWHMYTVFIVNIVLCPEEERKA